MLTTRSDFGTPLVSSGPRIVQLAAFIGRSVISSDGAEILSVSLGFLRVARSLRPGASAFWAPAFLAGTFLWPYAADSFFDPWPAAGRSRRPWTH